MSDNTKRIIVGIIGIPLVLLCTYYGGYPFFAFTLLLEILCLYEFLKMFETKGFEPLINFSIFISVFLFTAFIFFREYFVYFILVSLILFPVEFFRREKRNVMNPSLSFFGFVYITFPFVLMYELGKKYEYVFLLFLLIWAGDTFAYFGGKKFGKTKFSKISPNKTVEGLIIGFVFTVITSILFHLGYKETITLTDSIITGVLTGILGPAGDLFESFLKRYTGIKDSSKLIPGHGGVLDRFDSMIFALPVVYIYFNYIKELLN
ncbi:MAG: phosphatidate cytidylyltransferase [Ignavibacteria bacterium]|nr:phosphatidate cytidylyltransferase [Ignavibacteria bacterium]